MRTGIPGIQDRRDKVDQICQKLLEIDDAVEGGNDGDLNLIGNEDGRRGGCLYYLCYCCYDHSDEKKLEISCMSLFHLSEKSNEEELKEFYFVKYDRNQFVEIIEQLSLLVTQKGEHLHLLDILEKATSIERNATVKDIYDAFQNIKFTWYFDELHNFRMRIADVFGLADKNNDKTLYEVHDELQEFWQQIYYEIEQIKDDQQKKEVEEWLGEQKAELTEISYHQMQKLIWTGKIKYGFDVERIRDNFYKLRVPCAKRCGIFCYSCKLIRSYLTKSRINPKDPEKAYFSTGKVLGNAFGHSMHALDLFTDATLAYEMYGYSRTKPKKFLKSPIFAFSNQDLFKDTQFTNHYSIGFIIIVMAILGPYIVQYSALMSVLQTKGFFKEETYSAFSCLRKFYLYAAFTFFGLLIMPVIDLFLKIIALINILTIPFYCKQKGQRHSISEEMQMKLDDLMKYLFQLNSFELQNFEKQKIYAQVLFEDTLMLFLQALIISGSLSVPEIMKQTHFKVVNNSLEKNAFLWSCITTIISLVKTYIALWEESRGLQESRIEFVMLSVKAKNDWVPFGYKLMNLDLAQDIDFSLIEYKRPLLTDMLGIYQGFIYQFSEESLMKLTSHLDIAHVRQQHLGLEINQAQNKLNDLRQSQDVMTTSEKIREKNKIKEIKQFIPKLRFGFSLFQMNLHDFMTFLNSNYTRDPSFNQNKIDMSNINWHRMIKNSELLGMFTENQRNINGKTLLQICIENENSETGIWQLKQLMKILLVHEKLDYSVYDDKDQYTLLTYCYNSKKHQAFEMILQAGNNETDSKKKTNFINQKNKIDGSTIFGNLFYHLDLKFFLTKGYMPDAKLALLHEQFSDEINRNIPQIAVQGQNLMAPIYYYIKYRADINIGQSLGQFFDTEMFKQHFGVKDHIPYDSKEIQQLFLLQFEARRVKSISDELLMVALKRENDQSLFKYIEKCQENEDNFMHLLQCRFAEPFWKPFIKPDEMSNLKDTIKKLLKHKNEKGLTPLEKTLEQSTQAYNFTAISKLFDKELLDYSSFNGFESKIIQSFLDYFDAQYNSIEKKDQFKIDRDKFFKTFTNPQEAYLKMKQRFKVIDKLYVFDYYLLIDRFEEGLNDQQQVDELKQQFDQLMEQNKYVDSLVKSQSIDTSFFNATLCIQSELIPDQKRFIKLETWLNALIEWSSFADFISDMFVLYQLSKSIDTCWFSITMFTMLCPYYTVYSSLMTFKINEIRRIENFGIWSKFKYLFMVCPFVLILMIYLDILWMAINTIRYAFMLILINFEFGLRFNDNLEKGLNWLFKKLFGMSAMDIDGFKSQRTILQLHLESIPQILFQGYLLIRIPQLRADQTNNNTIKIDLGVIAFSLVMAIVHLILEAINSILESRTTQTRLLNYKVACYNARLNWIPQIREFYKVFDLDESQNNRIIIEKQSREFCNKTFGYSIEFEFSDYSIIYLTKLISEMPKQECITRQKVILLGQCIKNVQFHYVFDLLYIAHNKISIKFGDENLRQRMSSDKLFIEQIQRPREKHKDSEEEYHVIDMVIMNYSQIVKIMIDLGADLDVESKKDHKRYNITEGTMLFDIAYQQGNKEMLKVLMNHKLKGKCVDQVNQVIKVKDVVVQEVKSASNGEYLKQPLLLLDSNMMVYWDMLNSFIFSLSQKNLIQKYPQQAKQVWNVLFGKYVPLINHFDNTQMVVVLDQIKKWIDEYDENITLKYTKDSETKCLKLDTQFLCQFIVIRRSFFLRIDDYLSTNFRKGIDLTQELEKIGCTLHDILNVYKVFYAQLQRVNIDEIKRCDTIVKKMGFDKQWSQYFRNSRKILQDSSNDIQLFTEKFYDSKFTLGNDVQAVKQILVKKVNASDEPSAIAIEVQMPHYHYWCPKIDISNYQDDNDEMLAFVISYESGVNIPADQYRLRVMNLLITNQLQGGDEIEIKLYDAHGKEIRYKAEVTTYNTLE